MNTRIPPDVQRQIGEHLFEGRKIPAIKLYRERTGSDLLSAKNAVEALEAELRARELGRFRVPPAGRGCATSLAVLVIFVFVALGAVLLITA